MRHKFTGLVGAVLMYRCRLTDNPGGAALHSDCENEQANRHQRLAHDRALDN